MSHKRKDTGVAPREYAKHLRPYGKRVQAKAERQVAKLSFDTGDAVSEPIKRGSKKKPYGVHQYFESAPKNPLFSDLFTHGHFTWYKTERARDDAFRAISQHIHNAKQNSNSTQLNFKLIFGDCVKKVHRHV